jgi:hypothetical protein
VTIPGAEAPLRTSPAISILRRDEGLLQTRIAASLDHLVLSAGEHTRHSQRVAPAAGPTVQENFMDLTDVSDDRVARRHDEGCEGSGQ